MRRKNEQIYSFIKICEEIESSKSLLLIITIVRPCIKNNLWPGNGVIDNEV
jgi:hypothetical protein